jgi:hypothetical protein
VFRKKTEMSRTQAMLDIEERYNTLRDLLHGKGEGDISTTTRAWWCELVDLSDAWHELSLQGGDSKNSMVEEEERGVSALDPQIAALSVSHNP